MDDEHLTAEFFRWVEEHEDTYEFPLLFESVSGGVISFLLDGSLFTLDTTSLQISTASKLTLPLSAVEATQGETVTHWAELLQLTVDKFQELKEFEDSDEEGEFDLQQAPAPAVFPRQPVAHISTPPTHFLFQEAQEAISLLEDTIRRCASLEYSCSILFRPEISNIKLEIDLAFLDITDASMTVLGLNYESPLSISITADPNMLMQTNNIQGWTSYLIGCLSIEVHQDGVTHSYGCKHYIQGLVQKFKEDMTRGLKQLNDLPTLQSFTGEHKTPREQGNQEEADRIFIQLVEMGYDPEQAWQVARDCGGSIETAIDMFCAGLAAVQIEDPTNHVQVTRNLFYNMLFYLRDYLQKCTSYCFICYKPHATESVRLRPCAADICSFRFEEVSGVSVCGELQTNFSAISFDLSVAAEALFSGRAQNVFEPFPSFLLKTQQLRGRAGFFERQGSTYSKEMDSNKDLDKLQDLFKCIPDPKQMVESFYDDNELLEYLNTQSPDKGLDVLKLVKFILATNRLLLHKLEGSQQLTNVPPDADQFIVTSHCPEAEHEFNRLKAQRGSFFAFHGSALENWYSILRNGLRNLSYTHMMTAGAASGSGVYTASNSATSVGFCRIGGFQQIWPHSTLKGCGCMAIVEIVGRSSQSVYVVQNDRKLILRYILVLKQSNFTADIGSLGIEENIRSFQRNFFAQLGQVKQTRMNSAIRRAKQRRELALLVQQEQIAQAERRAEEERRKTEEEPPGLDDRLATLAANFAGQGSATATKRILQEYKYMLKSTECKGLTVGFDSDSNIYVWVVSLDVDTFELPEDLKGDFTRYSHQFHQPKEMVFEVRFDANFPFNPPFLRVVRPRFKFRTGHITIGGSICMQSLTPSGWIPVRTIESVFIEALYNISEGGARLELANGNSAYTLEEAKEAFFRVARQHNWL